MDGDHRRRPPNGRLSDEAYHQIREMVSSGQIPPGDVVRESELTEKLGMSRTPVREALRQLQAEEVLEPIPHRGYLVIEMTEAELNDVYRVREALESLAARTAATSARRTDVALLEDLVDDMAQAITAGDDERLAELNHQFHSAIASASGNLYLERSLRDIAQVFQRFRVAALGLDDRKKQAHDQHVLILEAIRNRDETWAADVAALHVREALNLRLRSVDSRVRGSRTE